LVKGLLYKPLGSYNPIFLLIVYSFIDDIIFLIILCLYL
jgi:hypothetical protein